MFDQPGEVVEDEPGLVVDQQRAQQSLLSEEVVRGKLGMAVHRRNPSLSCPLPGFCRRGRETGRSWVLGQQAVACREPKSPAKKAY
ncbi:hypothetical protein ACG3SK_06145 [Pseudomonas aeruginosa]